MRPPGLNLGPFQLSGNTGWFDGPFLSPAMTDDYAIYQAAVLEADAQRLNQAYLLASHELGIEPPVECWEEHVEYSLALTDLAREIMARLN